MKDYYKALGVDRNSSPEEIKKVSVPFKNND
jgi:DnaJ-class molecular chaperone